MNMCVLFVLILGLGQHSISVLGILQMDNLQLDLRSELDVMTKDVVTKRFVEDNAYHAYVFHSGIGNREELKVTSFIQNDAFRIGHNVEKWQTITSNSNIYMLGFTPQSIILTVASQKSSSNKPVGVTTQTLELPPNTVATASSMFEKWNSSIKAMEVILVVAVNSSTSELLWFNLNNNNAEKFWSWPRYKPVSCMVVFTVGRYLHLITINTAEKSYPTTADVYDIALSRQQLDFRLLHSLPLDESSFSIEIGIIGKETYLFIPQTQLGILLVFKYNYPSGSGGHGYFQHNLNITSPGVTRAYSFTTASQSYLAVNGESPNIYRIRYSGGFTKELDTYLSKVEDWLIIPVHTYRSEVIVLAKHNEDVKLLVWKGVDKGFSEGMMPPCDQTMGNTSSCLEGKFSGAVAVNFYNSPSILLPNYSKHSVLYHVIMSLDEVKDPVTSEIFQLEERKIFIQDVWDKQKKIKEEMKGPLSHTIKTNDTNTIAAKWVVESLETPALMDLGKTTYSKTYPLNSSSTSEDMGLTSLEEKIKNVNEKIYKLKTEVEDVGNSDWDLSNFSGKVLVKGTVSIQNLTLGKLNNKEVDKILHDSLRWDKPKIISGIKKVNSIKAGSVNFEKLNNFTATELSYADGPVVLSGNVTFMERLTVIVFVNLSEKGLVNGVDLSEKVCRVNENCPVTLTFENLTVQNNLIARTINNKSVEINSDEEPSEWSKVFVGNNVTVTYVNGNNWTDILKRVVYTDRDAFIPETTVVKGTLFSESDIPLRKLIVLSMPSPYIPQFREPENDAENIDITTSSGHFKNRQKIKKPNLAQQESSNSPAAAIRNQEIGMQSLLKDTLIDADVIFINVEVLDIVSADEDLDSNSWADNMADVILINETEPEVSGTKSFSHTLDIKKNLQVEGLVGGVNLSRVLTINTNQILDGVTTFHGNITFGNIDLSGTWDGVNVTILDMESVKLSTDHVLPLLQLVFNESSTNIDVQNLTITHLINNMSVNDIITPEEIKEGLKFNSLSATKLTVLGNINVTGKVCGWNLNELDKQRFSLTQDQNITGNFNFEEMNVTDVFEVQNIDGLNIFDLNHALNSFILSNNYSDIVFSELCVDGEITTSEGVAGNDLKAISKDAILLTGNNNIKAEVVFKDLLICEMLDVHDTVGGQNWTWFTKDVVYRDETFVVFEGKKTFESGFLVTGDLDVEEINGHRVEDILTTSTEQDITGEVRILGDLVVERETNLLGTLNERNISQLASHCYLPQETDSIVCTGDTYFDSDVYVNDLFFEKLINDINFNEYVKSTVFKNISSVISGRKLFTGDVTFSDLTLSTLNGQDFDKFLEDVVLMESDVEISQHITFVENLTVLENVVIDYNLDAPTILTYNLQDWVDNAVYLDRNMTVTGLKHFTSASSSGNISTHLYGDLDMIGGGIILLKQPQTITGTLKFDKLTSFSNIPVGHKVNNERLDELFENTLMIDWDQVVKSEIMFLEDIVIEGNLTTIGNVNKKDLKKVVTLHTNQTLSGQYVFDCLAITNMTTTTSLINGINITDWKQRAVMLDSDQEITGTWNIKGAVNFTHPVNDLVSLGNVNLHDRADQIKTQILDVELQMKENLTSLCNTTNILIHNARHQAMSLLYFESSQQIEVTPGYYKPHYFQAYSENYLFISKKNCNCNLYKWDNQSLQFRIVLQDDLNYFTHWVVIQHDKRLYAISLSDHSSSCHYRGVNLWLFTNNSLQFIMKLQINAKDLTSVESLQSIFYTLDTTTVKQWLLKDDEDGMLSVSSSQEWIISTTNEIRFLDPRSGLGLVITNGSHLTPILSSVTLPDNLLHHFSKEISTNSHSRGFLAVTSWEDSEVERRSDFVKIYKSNGILYDKLLTKRPSQLNWFSLQKTIWLAFIEDSAILQVYQHQDVFRGFQQKLSTNLQSSGLISISLPIEGKWNAHPYLLLFSNTLVQLIESKIVGDPYVGPDLSCYFDKSMNRLGR